MARVNKLTPDQVTPNSYRIARPVMFDGELFSKGDAVEFEDASILALFIRNHYITT